MAEGLSASFAALLAFMTLRTANIMTAKTAAGIRIGVVLMGIGALSDVVKVVFPVFGLECGGFDDYHWLLPAGAAISMMFDSRRAS